MRTTFELARGISGIYAIIHRTSGKMYVGSSVDVLKRCMQHIKEANGFRSTMLIHRALREFGFDAFDFELICVCPKELLLQRERFYIVLFNAASVDGFNTNGRPHAQYDKTISDVTRERIRSTNRAKGIVPPSRKGVRPSDEARAKQSVSLKGRLLSESHRAALVESCKSRPREHFENISKAKMGHSVSAECREKLRQANLGKKMSEEKRLERLMRMRAKKERRSGKRTPP